MIATRPATAPEQAPRTVAFPLCRASIRHQLTVAAAAAVLVLTNAATAEVLAARALPALKPNQPNQRIAGPERRHGQVMGMHVFGVQPLALAHHQHAAERRDARDDVHDQATGEVERTHRP